MQDCPVIIHHHALPSVHPRSTFFFFVGLFLLLTLLAHFKPTSQGSVLHNAIKLTSTSSLYITAFLLCLLAIFLLRAVKCYREGEMP